MKSPHTKKYTLAIPASPRCNQKLQESIFFSTPRKIKKQKISNASKNKTSFHRTMQTLTDTALNVNRFGQSVCGLNTSALWTDRRASGNSGFKKLAVQWLQEVQFSNGAFVVADSLRLRNRQLLKPAKR